MIPVVPIIIAAPKNINCGGEVKTTDQFCGSCLQALPGVQDSAKRVLVALGVLVAILLVLLTRFI